LVIQSYKTEADLRVNSRQRAALEVAHRCHQSIAAKAGAWEHTVGKRNQRSFGQNSI
jgi:hypothetical protein